MASVSDKVIHTILPTVAPVLPAPIILPAPVVPAFAPMVVAPPPARALTLREQSREMFRAMYVAISITNMLVIGAEGIADLQFRGAISSVTSHVLICILPITIVLSLKKIVDSAPSFWATPVKYIEIAIFAASVAVCKKLMFFI